MKILFRLFAFTLLLLPALAACSGSEANNETTAVANPDAPVVQIFYPPT
jgi:hypothetical protein